MRILYSKQSLSALAAVAALAISGCSSMSETECLATDWRMVGYEDGVAGYSGNRVGQHRKACGKHGVTPDLAQYQSGREHGLKEFCKPMNGFRIGARGNGYNGVCPAELDGEFTDAYQSGRQLFTLRSRVGNASEEIDSMRAESDRIDARMIQVSADILNPATTHEQRAQLLLESKQMAQRKGEIKVRIPQLESDRELYQRELEAYRATLVYTE